ncbi:hypothetical protein GGTG_11402 [Gaeumannomyces tritici R3-111a-1]|uniref:Bicarbonate transporter-like transmembrane domain-containing protein n=1 Tax=Gaeumannomyces tritici (strain R3-111a-1) TaxID=644352 RepID=J3PD31_GAET3|nr:hypothetical protein GGTG_11402 [Gaeumannomyces tritici R3-111a-1]EJT70376.1 hypothetical protein GGTG_11402 [Gaeumannomyces tritici R3-111a-1]
MPATDGSSMARGRGTERNPLVGGGGGGSYGATTNNRSSNNDNGSGQDYGRRRHRAVGFTETLSLRDKMRRWFAKGGRLEPFRLLKQDARNLRGRWRGDWSFFNQLVLASAVYVFFTNILPGITFASGLYALTGQSWGTVEVVFSTGLCGPLTILGVTGPFSVLAENLYELSVKYFHVPFLPLMAWSLIYAGWMHVLLAVFNAHDWTMQYVTEFSSDIFSLLNSVIYFHKAYKQLSRIHAAVPFASFLYSVLGAFGTCFTAVFLATAHGWAPPFGRFVRTGLTEYAAALSIMLWIAVPYLGELGSLEHHRLPVQSTSFRPTNPERDYFFVEFWKLPIQWVVVAIIPGAIITVLYYFDHEISQLHHLHHAALRRQEAGRLAWDVALLGITTAACGIMGIPPANGLLPQAPLHSESLRYLTEEKYEPEEGDVDAWACRDGKPEDDEEEDDGEFDGSDGVDSFDHDLNRSATDGRDGAGDAVSGRKGHDNLADLERDAVVTTNGRGGGSSNGRSSNGRRRSGHALGRHGCFWGMWPGWHS